jgi:hypothetical protein
VRKKFYFKNKTLAFQNVNLKYNNYKSCLLGNCVADPNAPTGSCLYGDDVVSAIHIINLVSFPTVYVTCAQAITLMVQNDVDPVFWCQSEKSTFGGRCCETCLGKIFFEYYITLNQSSLIISLHLMWQFLKFIAG